VRGKCHATTPARSLLRRERNECLPPPAVGRQAAGRLFLPEQSAHPHTYDLGPRDPVQRCTISQAYRATRGITACIGPGDREETVRRFTLASIRDLYFVFPTCQSAFSTLQLLTYSISSVRQPVACRPGLLVPVSVSRPDAHSVKDIHDRTFGHFGPVALSPRAFSLVLPGYGGSPCKTPTWAEINAHWVSLWLVVDRWGRHGGCVWEQPTLADCVRVEGGMGQLHIGAIRGKKIREAATLRGARTDQSSRPPSRADCLIRPLPSPVAARSPPFGTPGPPV